LGHSGLIKSRGSRGKVDGGRRNEKKVPALVQNIQFILPCSIILILYKVYKEE